MDGNNLIQCFSLWYNNFIIIFSNKNACKISIFSICRQIHPGTFTRYLDQHACVRHKQIKTNMALVTSELLYPTQIDHLIWLEWRCVYLVTAEEDVIPNTSISIHYQQLLHVFTWIHIGCHIRCIMNRIPWIPNK